MAKKNTNPNKWENKPTTSIYEAKTPVYVREAKSVGSASKRVIELGEKVEATLDGEWLKLKDGFSMAKFFKKI